MAERVQLVVRHEVEVEGALCGDDCAFRFRYEGETGRQYYCDLFSDYPDFLEMHRDPETLRTLVKRCPECLTAEPAKVEP